MDVKNADFETLPDSLEVYERRIDSAIEDFCLRYDVQSLKAESQSVFAACLTFIYRTVFKPSKTVFTNRKSILDYEKDIDTFIGVMNYYFFQCEIYDKAISTYDFCKMVGVDYSTLYEWSVKSENDDKLTLKKSMIRKRLNQERELSLVHKLEDGKRQPVSYIAVLNRQFGWALPGVTREEIKPNLTRDDMLQGLDALPEKPVGIDSSDE